MKAIFLLFIIISNILIADSLVLQKQNTLYTQNLISKEEQIAKAFEKYLLEEFKIPTMDDLQKNDTKNLYLGSNFHLENTFGTKLELIEKELKLKYAITKNSQEYVTLLYERDLYRDHTTVYKDKTESFVEISLKSKEAQNIFKILKSGKKIAKNCENPVLSEYCSLNKNIIKYYDKNKDWIEYSKKEFQNGDVNVSSINIFDDLDLKDNLKTGIYIFVKNTAKHIKFYNEIIKVK